MHQPFSFQASPATSHNATEANIFIHGYSAGHSDEDKKLLLDKIPGQLRNYTNIFAFWPSNHYLHFDKSSLLALGAAGLTLVTGGTGAPLAYWGLASSFAKDRRSNFTDARSRAERMGAVLLEQLSEYLRRDHPQVETINLIGHSLGGRVVISSLRTFTKRQQLAINDVLLMAAAVEVTAVEAQQMRGLLQGRLINAYSKADKTLLLNWGETSLGRNEVEHFESIEMNDFGHTDYWERLPEVLAETGFKASKPSSPEPAQAPTDVFTPAPPPERTVEEQDMTLELNSPGDIYQRISDELARIIGKLRHPAADEALDKAQKEAHTLLAEHQAALSKQLADLERNAEWNTFTIAFYGETGAGKSTLIETLRILLQEPDKLASQQAFRELRDKHGLSEENLQRLQQAISQTETRLGELAQQLSATLQRYEQPLREAHTALDQANARSGELTHSLGRTLQQHEQLHHDALEAVSRLQTLLAERIRTASLWQKLLNLFRKMPEEIELNQATAKLSAATATRDSTSATLDAEQQRAEQEQLVLERQLGEIVMARDSANAALVAQQAEVTQHQQLLAKQRLENESQLAQLLAELERQADGGIIGDGRADFTRQTQRYDLELNGYPFALLDVPGIEGKEGLVLSEIERAVQTAHAVFYVTNQPAPPQTGDEQRQGTLEKIKQHLGAQTEVWTIFNKKINNPKHSLAGRPLTSDDENTSLAGLNEKMREQLGNHYRDVFPLSARPAFLVSTDHFVPDSKNAKDRSKSLADFSSDELLEKSGIRDFLKQLGEQLIHDGKAKITRANFNKAKETLNQANTTLVGVQRNFSELSEKLHQDGDSAKSQLNSSFKALKQRLESCGETLIDDFASKVRKQMYTLIESDISNDEFKDALQSKIDSQQKQLSKQLPETMGKEIERFQKDVEDILNRFEKQAHELNAIYAKLNSTQLNGKFNFKLDLDNGIKVGSLLVTIGGAIAAVLGTGGWILAIGLAGLVFSFAKAVWSFFDSDYQKSQQKKSVDENLRSISEQLRKSLRDALKGTLPEMQQKFSQLEQAIEAPSKQTVALVKTLSQSTSQLNALSRQIEIAGNL
ncbi:DUF726 domain-containing protein [Pseudomonas pseudonitroreducens]|uniref:DUF726 domain-containing protein n=1 Tax=Pseudomonas pseudonitroreducens TaxID=2892326 RepID=UPI001F43E999|nr:DUF726 domain-containing protein [Pseudomonas pseudonitroreducens]